MIEYSIPAGRVYTAKDMLEDPHFAARQAIVEVETQTHGKVKMQNAFPKFSRTPSGIFRAAPARPGEHNLEVYADILGMDPADLDRLSASGVI
jgi:formyl-CoA transferase